MNRRAARFLERLSALRAIRALPILAVLAVCLLALSLAVHSSGLNSFDREVTLAIQRLRTPALDRWAVALTFLGNTATLVVLAFAVAAVYARYRKITEAWLVLLSLLALPLNILLKALVDRPRPTDDLVNIVMAATGLSFPSGHAMGSAAFYGCLAFTAWTIVSDRKVRILAVSAFVAVATAVGVSRIYLGVHWFSDVLGGWTSGVFCVILLAGVYLPWALARRREGTWGSSASTPG
jgi:undecaprenyl-diphosphatase